MSTDNTGGDNLEGRLHIASRDNTLVCIPVSQQTQRQNKNAGKYLSVTGYELFSYTVPLHVNQWSEG